MALNWISHFDTIELNSAGDCLIELGTLDGRPFPAGATAEIVWKSGPTWPATSIVGDIAIWKRETSDTAIIADRQTFTLWLHYPNPDDPSKPFDYPWIVGYAQRSPTETGFF